MRRPTISVRVSRPIIEEYTELARKTGEDPAKYYRNALYSWLDRNPDVELQGTIKKVVERRDLYLNAEEEKLYMKMENKRISNAIKENTFKEFMDNFMAQIYLSNSGYMAQSELEELLKENLKVLKERAEHHGELESYKARLESPVEYTVEYLDRKSRHDETFSDKFLSNMNGYK